MGILSDVLVASETEAFEVLNTESSARPWPWADVKGIDPVKLGRLEAILRGGRYDDEFVAKCEMLASSANDSTWVFRLPRAFTERLARVETGALEALAMEWKKAEEFALARWRLDVIQDALATLVRLARVARTKGQHLLLWVSM